MEALVLSIFFIGVAIIIAIAILRKIKEESDKVLNDLKEINRKNKETWEERDNGKTKEFKRKEHTTDIEE